MVELQATFLATKLKVRETFSENCLIPHVSPVEVIINSTVVATLAFFIEFIIKFLIFWNIEFHFVFSLMKL